jgi:uncharacterized membrane protein
MKGLTANRHLAGIAFLCLGIAIFSVQDAIIKLVSGAYPVTQIVFTRAVTGIPLLLAFVHFEAGINALITRRFWLLVIRAVLLFSAYTTYYIAFPALPLADAVALFFMSPVFVTALSIPVLGEKIRPIVWFAIALGFAGVVIMVKPFQSGFEPAALLSLMSAAFYATSMVDLPGRLWIGCADFFASRHHRSRPSEPQFSSEAVGMANNNRSPADGLLRRDRRDRGFTAHSRLSRHGGQSRRRIRIYRHVLDTAVGVCVFLGSAGADDSDWRLAHCRCWPTDPHAIARQTLGTNELCACATVQARQTPDANPAKQPQKAGSFSANGQAR